MSDTKKNCCTEKSGAEKDTDEIVVPDCCRHKSKERSQKEYKDLVNRLSRIEGQVRGVRKMLDDNAYCIDIMRQVSAINAALNSFNKVLLTNHMETCVMDEVKQGKTDKMEELIDVLPKFMK
ncbi:MAG: metal-sensing transcriptional repressor [Eubacteriales bacterium]|jgi:DNA-binding FrmR family transcriptional regulator